MKKLIKENFERFGFTLSDKQIEQFENYYNFLIEENEKYNLTAITQREEVVLKHFIDSVLPEKVIAKDSYVIDVGTGAGFPGIPLKILREDINLVLLDSLQKRINFLSRLIEILHLTNVTCVHARAEDYVKEKREKFDYAISRAVAGVATLSEYLIPYVKKGGQVLMYKGLKAGEELKEGEKAIKTLGGKVKEIKKFEIDQHGNREIIVIDKIENTDKKYPRNKNLPKTNPIK